MEEKRRLLWRGEYADEGRELFTAQRLLLEAVEQHVPTFLSQLEKLYPQYVVLIGEPTRDPPPEQVAQATEGLDFPDFGRLLAEEPGENPPLDSDPEWTFEKWSRSCDPANQFGPHLRGWAARFHLEADWVLDFGFRTLRYWHTFPWRRVQKDVNGVLNSMCKPLIINERPFTVRWDPELETRRSFHARALKGLEAYEESLRKVSEEHGVSRSRRKVSFKHFEWLALYQCRGWSLERICASAPMAGDKTTISKGISSAADLAGIKVRPKASKLKPSERTVFT
jgi:hypothetical protein